MKFNGPELDKVILGSHLRMMNFDAIEKYRKPSIIMDNIGVILAIGMIVYLTVR
jgi:hypothetical protein